MISKSTIKYLLRNEYHSDKILSFYKNLKKLLGAKRRCILIACMPKSGSTFLRLCLQEILKYKRGRFNYAFERQEQELYYPYMIDLWNKNVVIQQHLKATGPNLQLLNKFSIQPVILTRNIFDVVVSIRDYLLKEGVEKFPSVYATDEFLKMQKSDQYDFIITYALPWYFFFFVSWQNAIYENKINALMLNYEELIDNWEYSIIKILKYYNLEYNRNDVNTGIQSVYSLKNINYRFNRGVCGRGMIELNTLHIN